MKMVKNMKVIIMIIVISGSLALGSIANGQTIDLDLVDGVLDCGTTSNVYINGTSSQTALVCIIASDRCPLQDSFLIHVTPGGNQFFVIKDMTSSTVALEIQPGERVALFCNGGTPGTCGFTILKEILVPIILP